MSTITPNTELLKYKGLDLMRWMGKKDFISNPVNLPIIKAFNRGRATMGCVRDVGLTVNLKSMKMLAWGDYERDWYPPFRKREEAAEYYIITTIMDGSGLRVEYQTALFQGIKKGNYLPLGDGGMLLGYLKNPKWFVDIHMLVMECDTDLNKVSKAISQAHRDSGLDEVLRELGDAISVDFSAMDKAYEAVKTFISMLTGFLKDNGDDYVATIHDFYLLEQHFGQGMHPKSGMKRYQDVEAAYEIQLTAL